MKTTPHFPQSPNASEGERRRAALAFFAHRLREWRREALAGSLERAAPLALALLLGAAFGYHGGSRTGVRAAMLEAERAAESADLRAELPRLIEDMQTSRGQIEALRHAQELTRASERLHALEQARESDASQRRQREQAEAALLARVERLERREAAGVDFTPTGTTPPAQN